MKQSGDMCAYGIIISVPIRIMVGRRHLKQDIHSEFFERNVTKMLDHNTVFVFNRVIKGEHVTSATEFASKAVTIAEPELVLWADALPMRLLTFTESVVVTGMVAVVFF